MQGYDVRCPACGHMNQHVYLEETDGFMECEKCGMVTRAGMGAEPEAELAPFDAGTMSADAET